ncbi:MAG: LEA type 2 family protein [Longimicrobiales bacterium]
MMMRTLIRSTGLALMFALVGCLPDLEEPDVRVDGVRLGGLGLTGGFLYVELHVMNPNRFDLEADGLRYDVDLRGGSEDGDWVDFTEGEFREDIRVAGEDSTSVEIPVEFRYDALGSALRSMFRLGTLDYRITGVVQLEEPIGRDIPFRKTGRTTL